MVAGCRTYPSNTIRSHRVPQQLRRIGVADAMMDTLCGHSAPSEAQDTFSPVVTTKTADMVVADRFHFFVTGAAILCILLWPCTASYQKQECSMHRSQYR